MKFHFWSIGKNNEPYIKEGVEDFTKRISKYYPGEVDQFTDRSEDGGKLKFYTLVKRLPIWSRDLAFPKYV